MRPFQKRSKVLAHSTSALAVWVFLGFSIAEPRAQTPYEWVGPTPGSWNVSDPNWTLGAGPIAWQNGAANQAFFGSVGGTITLTTPIIANRLTFATSGYELDGGSSLTLAGTAAGIEVASGQSATLKMVIEGSAGLRKTGAGTVVLTAANTYTGGTQLLAGTLLIDDDDALGNGPLTLAGGTTFGTASGAAIITDPDVDLTINGNISIQVDGFLQIDGTVDLGNATRSITLTDTGLVCFMGAIQGSGGLTLIAGGGPTSVMMCGPDNNTYTGLTIVGNDVTLTLNKDPGVTAIAGNLEIQSAAKVVLFDWSNQINPTATVTVNGTLEIDGASPFSQTIGNLQGSGTVTNILDAATLEIRRGNFSGTFGEDVGAGQLSVVKSGSGVLTLNGASTYSGGTVINEGTLRTTQAAALGTGAVTLNAGGSLNPVGTLTITSLTWNGGTLAIAIVLTNAVSLLEITGNLTLTGIGIFDFTDATGFTANTEYRILTAANLDTFSASRFAGNVMAGVTATFRVDPVTDSLWVSLSGAAQGLVIQNSGPYFTPETADFLVIGAAQTGGPADNNTVNSLTFVPGSSLQVSNILTVTSGSFTVNEGSATITGGALFAPGAFNKLGAGTLNLLTNVFVNGPATVRAGSLLINGPFAALGGLTISPNALLGGNAFILGNVLNYGTLAPGNSPGILAIAGNLTLSGGSTTQLEIASLSLFDRILVSGLATLGGTLAVVPYGGNELEYGQQFNFLIAGEVAGEFDAVTMPKKFRGRIVLDDGEVTLIAAPSSYTLVAQNQNQFNVAAALDGFIPATSGDRLTVSTALDELTAAQYPAAFDQISPGFYQSLTSTTIEQYNSQGQFLQQRFSSVALGRQAGFAQYGINAPALTEKTVDSKNPQPAIETPQSKWGIWTLGNGLFAKSSIASIPNYRSDSGGFLVGGDYRWSETFVTGVFGGYQGTASRYDNGGRTTINAARFGAYATYDSGNGFYANTVVGGGYSAYDVKRPIQFGSVNRAASSAPGGAEFTSQLAAGYDWKAGGFTFGPIGNLQYTYAGVGGFGENGAESLNLRVGQQNANSLRSTLGVRAAYTWVVSDKIAIIPEMRMSWQHEFLMYPTGMSAALDGGSGPGFGYTSTAPARDAVFAGAGVTLQIGDRWNANVYYNADFGRSDYTSQMISGGLGVSF